MNRKMVLYMIGQVMKVEGLLMLLPAGVAALYTESCVISLLISAGIAFGAGLAMTVFCKTKWIFDKLLYIYPIGLCKEYG